VVEANAEVACKLVGQWNQRTDAWLQSASDKDAVPNVCMALNISTISPSH